MMPGNMDNDGGVEQISAIMSELAEALGSETITVKLQNGREIVGPVLGFSVRRKERKGDISWSGTVRIQIDPGELEIDCQTIEKVFSR
jgi:hypothetical protein